MPNKKLTTEQYLDDLKYTREDKGEYYNYSLVDYTGNQNKIKIICPIDGIFEQRSSLHKLGFGCPRCRYGKHEVITRLFKMVEQRGGEITSHESNDLINNTVYEHIKLKCNHNHEWETAIHNILRGCWCPKCGEHTSVSEEIIRCILQHHYKKEFKNCRPDWLINPNTGQKLELDLYSEELKLAFEYNGYHHLINEDQQKRDIIKSKICKKKNIKLITIPQFNKRTANIDELYNYIKNYLQEYNIFLNINLEEIDFTNIYMRDSAQSQINKLKIIVIDKGGNILEGEYINSLSKFKIECREGHIWETSYSNIIDSDTWCPECKIKNISNAIKKMATDKRATQNNKICEVIKMDFVRELFKISGYRKDIALFACKGIVVRYQDVEYFIKKSNFTCILRMENVTFNKLLKYGFIQTRWQEGRRKYKGIYEQNSVC